MKVVRVSFLLVAALLGSPVSFVNGQTIAVSMPVFTETPEIMLLQVDINRQRLDETVLVLKDRHGGLFLAADDLARWRVRLPDTVPFKHADQNFYQLSAVAGSDHTLDGSRSTLFITLPAQAFTSLDLQGAQHRNQVLERSSLGGFFNYDLFWEGSDGSQQKSGLFEAALFNQYGVGITTVLAKDTPSGASATTEVIRLDSTWTTDWPDQMASLRIGDAIGHPGSWGRAIRFGGIQYATNFATQPGFITLPMQNMTGQAVLPSTVDVYINNVLSSRKEVPPGPFSINNIPVVTGAGDVRVVVRDLLGREQVISQPFYASPSALAKGVESFSYELGAWRQNYGQENNDYGAWMATATHRKGLTDVWTGEIRAEIQADQQTVGLGTVLVPSSVGVLNGTLAASHDRGGFGYLAGVGFQRQSAVISMGFDLQVTSERFTQNGLENGAQAPQRLARTYFGSNFGRYGSLGLSYLLQNERDGQSVELVSASYSFSLGPLGFVGISFNRTLTGSRDSAFGLVWTVSLGQRTTGSANVNKQQSQNQRTAQIQQSLPSGSGFGYLLQIAENGASQNVRAGLAAQNSIGTYSLETARSQGQTANRLGAAGGVAILGGGVHLSRKITDSFGLVKVPDYPNVRVYADNQPVGVTNDNGNVLLPRLRPFEKNPISIEQLDLPHDATIGTLKLNAVPRYRSGIVLPFPVTRSYGAVLTIKLEDGEHLPAGTLIGIAGQNVKFPVGHDGQIYLTGLTEKNYLRATFGKKRCELTVPFEIQRRDADPLPDLGVFVCHEVQQ